MHARKKAKRKKRNWAATIILTIMIIGIAAVSIAAAATVFVRSPDTNYETVEANRSDITTYYSFSGNVEAKNRQTVISDRVMQVSEIKVEEGDIVEEGDVLVVDAIGEEIVAGIDGEVTRIQVEENAQVMAGAILMEVVDYENLQVIVLVDEYDLAAIEEGKETWVTIRAIDKEVRGEISSLSKEGQTINGVPYFTATVNLDEDESLRIGLSAEVKLIRDEASGVVILPMEAIQFDDNNQPYVLRQGENGSPVTTEITTGINDGTIVEIKSGVVSGDTILYGGATPGQGIFPPAPPAGNNMGFGGGGN